MKTFALVCCLLLLANAAADEGDGARVRARQMRKAGAGVMGVGLIHLGAGLALSLAMVGLDQRCDGRPFPCGEGLGLLMVPAFTLIALGSILTGIGMPLYFVGQRREKRLRQLALMPTPMGQLTPVPPMPQ